MTTTLEYSHDHESGPKTNSAQPRQSTGSHGLLGTELFLSGSYVSMLLKSMLQQHILVAYKLSSQYRALAGLAGGRATKISHIIYFCTIVLVNGLQFCSAYIQRCQAQFVQSQKFMTSKISMCENNLASYPVTVSLPAGQHNRIAVRKCQ